MDGDWRTAGIANAGESPDIRVVNSRPEEDLATVLVARLKDDVPTTVTWLNHHSALEVLRRRLDLTSFSHVGIDGTLLQLILRDSRRTSADLVLPVVLRSLSGARVGLVGGPPKFAEPHRSAVEAMLGSGSKVCMSIDGYSAAPLDRLSAFGKMDLLIVGMGAGIQDELVQEAVRRGYARLAITCGGFLDQSIRERYYPPWAYPLKLNWLIRLILEPRRLWRRYTVEGVVAMLRYGELRRMLLDRPRVPGVP